MEHGAVVPRPAFDAEQRMDRPELKRGREGHEHLLVGKSS